LKLAKRTDIKTNPSISVCTFKQDISAPTTASTPISPADLLFVLVQPNSIF